MGFFLIPSCFRNCYSEKPTIKDREDTLSKIGSYETELVNLSPRQWIEFLKKHSHLPGPRANNDLAQAFAHIGTLMDFKKLIRLEPEEAPENTPEEFLTYCGVLGYGQYLASNHDRGLLNELKQRANDPRERIRKAVIMALQNIGKKNISRLLKYAKSWSEGTYLEQWAAVVALCEPEFLKTQEASRMALDLLDWVTATIVQHDNDQQNDGYRLLKQGLSSGWSVAVAALPEKGKPMMERWMKENHPVVNQIMSENLKKKRLSALAPKWTQYWLSELDG